MHIYPDRSLLQHVVWVKAAGAGHTRGQQLVQVWRHGQLVVKQHCPHPFPQLSSNGVSMAAERLKQSRPQESVGQLLHVRADITVTFVCIHIVYYITHA